MQHELLAAPLFLSAAVLLALGLYGLTLRRVAAAVIFALAMLLCAAWAAVYSLEILGVSLETKLVWARLRLVPIAIFPLAWFALALRHTRHDRRLSRMHAAALLLVPAVTVVLALTTSGLLRRDYRLDPSGAIPTLLYSNGPWFYVHLLYSYSLMIASVIVLAASIRGAQLIHRRQTWLLVAGILLPNLTELLYQAGLSPLPGVNLSPMVLTVSGLLVGLALFRYRLLDLAPLAGRR